jgi:hypothetical protein
VSITRKRTERTVHDDGMPMVNRGRPQRRRWIAARLAAVGALVAVALLAAPGAASAGTNGTVSPLLDCVTQNSNGSYTAVMGYSNTARNTEHIAYGYNNVISPSTYDRRQPTSFKSGTHHGVFTVTLTASDIWSNPTWTLDGHRLDYTAAYNATSCPPGTQMPSVGNGAGAAIGLLVAGLVGAFVVRRYRRRMAREVPHA